MGAIGPELQHPMICTSIRQLVWCWFELECCPRARRTLEVEREPQPLLAPPHSLMRVYQSWVLPMSVGSTHQREGGERHSFHLHPLQNSPGVQCGHPGQGGQEAGHFGISKADTCGFTLKYWLNRITAYLRKLKSMVEN